jgi:tetratricopeptide (TPR) repeat protein
MLAHALSSPEVWLIFLGPLFLAVLFDQSAKISQRKEVFRTYPFGDPDPVALMGNIYPYFRFDGFNLKGVDQEWQVVTLENPYIKVLIAPEIGGKILGAFEKSTAKAFIYFNRVVKFREVAMRGPWTSGGIEFNFGDFGHAPTTATPVDYCTRANDDGSVSCIVGALDLSSRTEWRVEVRLPKDKAYFETRSLWYNPTELNTSMYHWMNAAIDVGTDLHLEYPGTLHIDHEGNAFPWPKDTHGRDLSFYGNNAFGTSKEYHVLGEYADFFGAYWASEDLGVVHWSRYGDKPGKKIWMWAQSREGEIWKDLLTDPEMGNGQYVEIQSGLLFHQAGGRSSRTPFKHMFFQPNGEDRYEEIWFPYVKIGGVVEANTYGSLNVQRMDEWLRVGFCPIQSIDGDLVVKLNGKDLHSKHLLLRPMEVFVDSFKVIGEGEIEVKIGDYISYGAGNMEARKLQRPVVARGDFDWSSVFSMYTDAVERAKQRDYRGALEQYLACLSKDPAYTPALTGVAEMFYRRMEYGKALEYAKRALANDAYDPDANFVYGIVNRKLGKFYDAVDGFGFAARSMKFRSAANVQLAEIAFLMGKSADAEEYAQRALDYNRYNIAAQRLLALNYRRLGQLDKARRVLDEILEIDPLSHYANFEKFLIDPSAEKLSNFRSMIRCELPHESYLELASYYRNLGLDQEATKVLENAPSHAMVYYWQAYLSDKTGDPGKSQEYLEEALKASPHLIFPFRQETADVLAWAETKQPHWKSKYYMALLYWSKNRFDFAKKHFAECGDDPDYAPFYLARGKLLEAENPERALKDYRRAMELGQDEWRVYHRLTEFHNERGEYDQALRTAKDAVERFPGNHIVQYDYGKTLLLNRQFEKTVSALETITILPFEGAQHGHETYRQACVLYAVAEIKAQRYAEAIGLLEKARSWPEHLGVGKPYDVDNRLEDYLEALCRRRRSEKTKDEELLQRIVLHTEEHPERLDVNRLFGILALRDTGKGQRATKLMDEWLSHDVNDIVARWSFHVFHEEYEKARDLEQALQTKSGGSFLSETTADQGFLLVIEVFRTLAPP